MEWQVGVVTARWVFLPSCQVVISSWCSESREVALVCGLLVPRHLAKLQPHSMCFYFLSFWPQNLPLHFQLGELCAICFPNLMCAHCHWQKLIHASCYPGALQLHSTGGNLSVWPPKAPLGPALNERQSGLGGICWHPYLNGCKWCRLKTLIFTRNENNQKTCSAHVWSQSFSELLGS